MIIMIIRMQTERTITMTMLHIMLLMMMINTIIKVVMMMRYLPDGHVWLPGPGVFSCSCP